MIKKKKCEEVNRESIKSNDISPKNLEKKITKEIICKFDDKSTAKLAQRLEDDDYSSPFEGLDDWHLLRALAIHRPELTLPYLHLIDQEPFDED